MKKRVRQYPSANRDLPMTSMIDVVFLLLVFFMCANVFKNPEGALRAYLPKGGDGGGIDARRDCRIRIWRQLDQIAVAIDDRSISIDTPGHFESQRGFNGGLGPNEKELLAHLEMRTASYETDGSLGATGLPVIIDFSHDVPSKYVVQMLNLCHRARVIDVAFAQPEMP